MISMAKKSQKKQSKNSAVVPTGEIRESKPVRVDYSSTESVRSTYANNLVVQSDEHCLYLSFFEVVQPVILGTQEDMQAKLDEISCIQAQCAAKVVIPNGKAMEFLQVLLTQMQRQGLVAGEIVTKAK